MTSSHGGADDTDAQAGHLVVAPSLTAGWGTNHGSPGNGGKDDAVLAALTAQLDTHTHTHSPTTALTSRCGDTQDDQQTGQLVTVSVHATQDPIGGDEMTPAISAEPSGAIAVSDGVEVRRLTPLECERLQGFPDGWTEGQSDSHRYAQLGNAVPAPVVEWIGRRLLAVHSTTAEV